jgi:hypothetical protein
MLGVKWVPEGRSYVPFPRVDLLFGRTTRVSYIGLGHIQRLEDGAPTVPPRGRIDWEDVLTLRVLVQTARS